MEARDEHCDHSETRQQKFEIAFFGLGMDTTESLCTLRMEVLPASKNDILCQ